MEIVSFDDVRNALLQNMQRDMLIPIIGAGFTCGCRSRNGKVPSGKEYKKYMISEISKNIQTDKNQISQLENDLFSNVAEIYYSEVPKTSRIDYLKKNFSNVVIENYKKDFLKINWPYIYTINLDDGIERNSIYNHVVLPDKEIFENVFDDNKCVIKIHGDVAFLTTYKKEDGVLTQKQYLKSLKSNKVLLNKLEHDHYYQNIIYIGCSLDDEIDIKSLADYDKPNSISTSRYFCSIKKPSPIEEIKYRNFGISHFVIFDSYEDIYINLYELWEESKRVSKDDLDLFRIKTSNKLAADYDKNKSYLLQGKGLLNRNNITFPYFFISRKIIPTIFKNFNDYTIQILIGNGCSGKSYILADIANKIKDSDVYLFESKERLNDDAFECLLKKRNSVLLFDNKTLNSYQIEKLIDSRRVLQYNETHIIIATDKNNQELDRVLSLKKLKNELKIEEIKRIEIKNKLVSEESNEINALLSTINLGIFDNNKTIVDNIINISDKLVENNKYRSYTIKTNDIYQISALIMLAIEHKIYSHRVTQFNLNNEFELHVKCSKPLIEKEIVWNFEKKPSDNSPFKYVIEADYWLRFKLQQYAQITKNQENIVKAFEYIVSQILDIHGKPQLRFNDNSIYKEYVLFDNINKIFSTGKNNEMILIRKVYETLNPLLSVDPNFKHQYAKCYIQSAKKEKDDTQKIKYLNEAYRNICEALEIFNIRYNDNESPKLLISIAHAKYTQAVIICHLCFINNYTDQEKNTQCIDILDEAMKSDHNSVEYIKKDTINYNNVVQRAIGHFSSCREGLQKDSIKKLEKLINKILNKN